MNQTRVVYSNIYQSMSHIHTLTPNMCCINTKHAYNDPLCHYATTTWYPIYTPMNNTCFGIIKALFGK